MPLNARNILRSHNDSLLGGYENNLLRLVELFAEEITQIRHFGFQARFGNFFGQVATFKVVETGTGRALGLKAVGNPGVEGGEAGHGAAHHEVVLSAEVFGPNLLSRYVVEPSAAAMNCTARIFLPMLSTR